jgi:D-threonine aldolase
MDAVNYQIINVADIHTPALVVYPSIVKKNIKNALAIAGTNILRPHIKTCKTPGAVKLMMDAGITHFKCATIAEADMLGMLHAKDVLLAYQPVAINIQRLKNIIAAYPGTTFSCLIDNADALMAIENIFKKSPLNIFIDLNAGMNRTGILPQNAKALIEKCLQSNTVFLKGIHAYDGHINDVEINIRKQRAQEVYEHATAIKLLAKKMGGRNTALVIGGTPTFPFYAKQHAVQCSPGTFIFWDDGYACFTDLPFTAAALVVTRIISIIDKHLICLDMGHKAIASENPLHKRIKFLTQENIEVISHSEEHLVVKVADTTKHHIGDVWYGIPFHICPTVALYNEVEVIENGYRTNQWKVIARDRKLNF